MTQREPVMDWPAIIAEVHRRGMTLSALATREGVQASAMTRVRSSTNYKCQAVLAEFLGHRPEDLWPSRYPKGKPRILDTAKYPAVASQNSDLSADMRGAA